jgi:hypothetical protein
LSRRPVTHSKRQYVHDINRPAKLLAGKLPDAKRRAFIAVMPAAVVMRAIASASLSFG